MARPASVRFKKPVETWYAVRGPYGRWVVVNEHGSEPLRSTDPLAQMMAAHLAAAAPGLRESLEELARRLLHLETAYGPDYRRAEYALGLVSLSRPSGADLVQELRRQGQLELDLSDEVA